MKRNIIIILGTMLMLTGCGNRLLECEKTTNEDGYILTMRSVATINANNVSIVKHYAEFKFEDNNKEMLDLTYTMLNSSFEGYNDYDGIKYLSKKTDNDASFEIIIDINKASKTIISKNNNENGVINITAIPKTQAEFLKDAESKGLVCK